MSKIICDVCGTRYPDTADQCPICGYANVSTPRQAPAEPRKTPAEGRRAAAAEPRRVPAEDRRTAAAEPVAEQRRESHTKVQGGRFSKENVRKRNQGVAAAPVYSEPAKSRPKQKRPEPDGFDEEVFEAAPREKAGVLLNIMLVIVILALLAVTAYIAKEYFLPNYLNPEEETTATVSESDSQDDPTESEEVTDEPTVPCTGLTLVGMEPEITLDGEGRAVLLNVAVAPQDTTDKLTYVSDDEDVVSVNAEGRVTAVGKGKAVVTVFCGDQKLECTVRCAWDDPTEEATTETAND